MAKTSSTKPAPETKKRVCPIDLDTFADEAKPLMVQVSGQVMTAVVKAPFSTGSFGWNANGKMTIMVGDTPVEVQVGLNLTVIGSKELANGSA